MRFGLQRKLSAEELMTLNCGLGGGSWESLGLQGLVHPKGNQSWIFIGRSDSEADAPTLWPPDAKNRLPGKDPDAGKDQRQEEGTTEDQMVGWYHWLNGHEFEKALGVGDGQRTLACCSPCDHKESDMTEWLNWLMSIESVNAIQPSHPLLPSSSSALSLSQHQGLFQGVGSLYQVAKVLEFQLQHQSFQWIFRTDFL